MNDCELIIALGGTLRVAELCGVSQRSVQHWLHKGLPNNGIRKYLEAEFRGQVNQEVRKSEVK